MVGENTGNVDAQKLQAFADCLKACDEAKGDEQVEKMVTLNKAFAELKKNGVIQALAPDSSAIKADLTQKLLVDESHFTRQQGGDARFGKPRYWSVENFLIPNGESGVKNGLDKYSGDDCLMLGVWNDRQANRSGNLENARIYRKVKLDAGRYYFGAKYNTMYNMGADAYIFASKKLVDTKELPDKSLAHAILNRAQAGGDYHGITFTLTQPQEVMLGFQADLKHGSATKEMRAEAVKLLYYGE